MRVGLSRARGEILCALGEGPNAPGVADDVVRTVTENSRI